MESVKESMPVWKRWHDDAIPIRVGVSACLLGAEVRFDGGHKRDRYVTDVLGMNVDWRPTCPELEIGLGVPRPVIQLRGGDVGDRLVTRVEGTDLTEKMRTYAEGRVDEFAGQGIDGFVLKKGSPTCGMERVRVYGEDGAMPLRTGIGHFARAIERKLPQLPIEEEGRLNDPVLRERFIEAIFSHNRWRVLVEKGLSRGRLVAFHEAHKMLILAHDEPIYRDLGRVVASFGREEDDEIYKRYAKLFLSAFKKTATPARHVNVLEHLFGHMKQMVGPREKREIAASIDDYRSGRVPLVVPITLLRFLVAAHEVEYVQGQIYLEPHPRELMLRNHA